ncbi:MAG: DUF2071 domain-containing protein [Candidatus Sulfotelmatobacter sp.]
MANKNESHSKRVFLSAEWRDLVMLNYEVEPSLLSRYVPAGTSLDSFDGKTYVSLVGFRFLRTRLFGRFPVPFHRDFDEVNLRFYVRRKAGKEIRTGVVFVAEIVPRHAIAAMARIVYGENYKYAPMKHRIETPEVGKTAEYEWQIRGRWCRLSAQTAGPPERPRERSLEQFIAEHYWGYSGQPHGPALEYHVSHVPWQVWKTSAASFDGDGSAFYGHELGIIIQRRPDSAFMADGSSVLVFKRNRIQ